MPEFSVTGEQLERLDALRADLEAAFVDGYGHVRRRDALDYLLDTHAPPVEVRVRTALDRRVRNEAGEIDYPALQSVARNTEGVRGSGIAAEEMYEAVLAAKVSEAADGGAVALGLGSPVRTGGDAVRRSGDPADPDGSDDDPDATEDAGSGDPVPAEDDADAGSAAAGEESPDGREGADDAEGREPTPEPGSADSNDDGGSQLRTMMSLLSTHNGKWRKAESGDAPYEVDLPDGGTEPARTKDDVKRILFTNY